MWEIATWLKVCGQMLVEHLIPTSCVLIWSWSPFAAITASTLLGSLSTRCWNNAAITASTLLGRLSTRCWNIAAITASTLLGRLSTRCWNIASIQTQEHLLVQALTLGDSSQRCSMGLRLGLCAGQSRSSTLNSTNHLYGPRFVHRGIVMLKQERMLLYAVALRFPFTGTKEPKPNLKKQPQTIIPPPPNFTVNTMHSVR